MADAPTKPQKPPVKPKPTDDAIRAARAKSLATPTSNQFFPTGLSGDSSPSTPPRRPPPSVPVRMFGMFFAVDNSPLPEEIYFLMCT